MKAITGITVDSLNYDHTTAAVGWSQDGSRFHTWIHARDAKTWNREGPIYKNPALGIERGQPGHFDPRKLDPDSPKNAAILRHVFDVIERDGLIAKAIAAKAQADRDEAERQRQLAVDERRTEFRKLLTQMWVHDREELLSALSDQLSMDDLDALQARLP